MEEWRVAGDVPDCTHSHEEVETGHVDAGEKSVDLTVGGFVEVVVVPETTENQRAAMTRNIITNLTSLIGIESQQLIDRLLEIRIFLRAATAEPIASKEFIQLVKGNRTRERLC